jgi:hypothetical protein
MPAVKRRCDSRSTARVIPYEINRSRLTSQSTANRAACIPDAVSVGKDHWVRFTRSATQREAIDAKHTVFEGLSFIWSALPNSAARYSAQRPWSGGRGDPHPPRVPAKAVGFAAGQRLQGPVESELRGNPPDIASRYDVFCGHRPISRRSAAGAASAIIKQCVEQQSQRASSSL